MQRLRSGRQPLVLGLAWTPYVQFVGTGALVQLLMGGALVLILRLRSYGWNH